MTRTGRLLAALAMVVAGGAQAQSPIVLQGNGPFHRLELPLAIYGLAAFDDLRDLRVRNGAGQAVPFGWLDGEPEPAQSLPTSLRAPLFALPPAPVGASTASGDDLLSLKLRPDGSIALARAGKGSPSAAGSQTAAEWVIDASQVKGALVQIRFELKPGAMGLFPYTLERSDDLRRWRSLGGDDALLRLRHGEQTIERLAVEVDQVHARFLRLRWQEPALAPQLAAVWLDSIQQPERAVAAIAWSAEVRPSACGVDHCDYLTPQGLPLQSLRVTLDQPNTLAPVRIFSVLAPQLVGDEQRSRPRSALYLLRHGGQNSPRIVQRAETPGETLLVNTTVYRLNQLAGEARSAAIPMDGGVHGKLRLRTVGPIAALGASPLLSFGARPRALVFLAQGRPPFTLTWNASAQGGTDRPGPLPLAQLMPGYQRGHVPAMDGASVVLALARAVAPPAAAAVANKPVPNAELSLSSRKVWLWAALGVGLLLLAGMAWSLLRGLKAPVPE